MPGYEENRFVDLPEISKHLFCSICLNICKNAINTFCDHTFCKDCIENCIRIPTNPKKCPDCRKNLIKRKRNLTTSLDDNLILVNDYVFRTNLMANNMINDLKIRCNYESNGCQEVIQLGLLSSHLKECEHKLCRTCGFTVEGNGQHIPQTCIELLKSDRNQLKDDLNETNEKFNELKEKDLKLNETLNELKEKNRKLEEKAKRLEKLPEVITKLESNGVYLSRVSGESGSNRYNIELTFAEIQELIYCLHPKNVIILKPVSDACLLIKQNIFANDSPNGHKFNVDSEDSKHWYIIIALKRNIDVYVSHLITLSKDMSELKVAEISDERVNHFIERAKN